MPNKKVFKSATKGKTAPVADAVNNAGGAAYALSKEAALATFCCTGCINDTYYVKAETQLKNVLEMCNDVSPEFIAKTAVYSRSKSYMKDMPALLLAVLLTKDKYLFNKAFPKVVDNVKMLRSFIQILRSGVVGRKSLGMVATKAVRRWIDGWNDANKLFNSSVGDSPSLGDIVRLAHPKPKNEEFSALFAYLCGFTHDPNKLPDNVKKYELLKKNYSEGITWDELPDINFQYLTSVKLTPKNWEDIAKNASWQTTRMNLNTFARHGVFKDTNTAIMQIVAERLRNKEEIAKSKVFPYTLLQAYKMSKDIPSSIRDSLQDAMELSIDNVPTFDGKVIVAVDSSGSMNNCITGNRGSSSSVVKCSDVAGLVGAAIKRKNPDSVILSFDTSARIEDINSRDSVMTNANKLSRAGGGTDISCGISLLNDKKIAGDLLVIVSDNESWFDSGRHRYYGTPTQQAWNEFKVRNPKAKCVCIDIQPNSTSPMKESRDVINVSGFSDNVFSLLENVVRGSGEDTFVNEIKAVVL